MSDSPVSKGSISKLRKGASRGKRLDSLSGLGWLFVLGLTHEMAEAKTDTTQPESLKELLELLQAQPEKLEALVEMILEAYPEIADRLLIDPETGEALVLDPAILAEQLAELEAGGYLETEETQRLLASLRALNLSGEQDTDEDIQLAQAGEGNVPATDAGAGAAGAGEAGAVDIATLPATGAGPAAIGLGQAVAGLTGFALAGNNITNPPGTTPTPAPAPLTVTLTDAEAAAQVLAGVQYAQADNVTIEVPGSVAGTQLQTSLKGMQTLGVDTLAVLPGVGTGDVMVTAFNTGETGPLLSSLPALTGGARVGIDVTQAEFDAFTAADLLAFGNGGFDLIGADGIAAGSLNITDAQAGNMIDAGLVFAAQDDVSLDVTAAAGVGTQLQTSLTGLQGLGVDSVDVSGGGSVIINAGTGAIDFGALPDVNGGANDTLRFSDTGFAALTPTNLQALNTSGFDRIGAVDGSLSITDAQAGDMIGAGLVFANLADITLDAVGTELGTSVTDLNTLGVDAVSALDTAIGFSSSDATALINNGIDLFFTNSDNTLDVTLARLADIGADRIFTADLAPVTLEVNLGETVLDINELQTALNNIISDFELHNGAIGSGINEFRDLFEGGDTVNLNVTGTFTGDLSGLDPDLVAKLELLGIDDILNSDGTSLK